MNYLQPKSQTYIPSTAGEQGLPRERTRSMLNIATGVSFFVEAIKKHSTVRTNVGALVDQELELAPGVAKRLASIYPLYIKPRDPGWVPFKYGFLCGMGVDRLEAFVPHLTDYYENPDTVFVGKLWLTEWSIEAAVSIAGSPVAWQDLRLLSVEQIRDLATLVQQPTANVSVNVAAPSLSPPELATSTMDDFNQSIMEMF